MSNAKISALTSATTPLAGTETLPIVQSSTTKQVSVANLTAGRAVSAASLALTTTPLPATSGGTGTATAFTDGSVIFAGASGVYSQDNANLFYKFSNKSLGIGTASPAGSLDVRGTGPVITAQQNAAGSAAYYVMDTTIETGGKRWRFGYSGATTFSNFSFLNVTDNVTALNLAAAGDVTVNTGNLIPGTAAKGINFTANTPAAGKTSQLLNWYEEGTWTPALTSAGGNFTTLAYGDQQGSYTRVGRMVTVRGNLFTSGAITAGSASGQVYISGLPFAASVSNLGQIWTSPDTANYNSPLALATGVQVASSNLRLYKNGTVNNSSFNVTDLYTVGGPSNNIYFQATYFV